MMQPGCADELALARALAEGRLGAAVLDVYEEQPLRRDHPLLALDNAILTPHTAGLTQESMKRMSVGAAEETLRLLAFQRPVSLCNPAVWENHLRRHALRP